MGKKIVRLEGEKSPSKTSLLSEQTCRQININFELNILYAPSIDEITSGLRNYSIWRNEKVNRDGGWVAILTRKGIILKELEIQQRPIVEL